MARRFFEERRPHEGLSYADYEALVAEEVEQSTDGLPDEERERIEFTRLNRYRARRIVRTYRVSRELEALLRQIVQPQLWMVLTEPWCGDSAQSLPYIAALAGVAEPVELRILLRDDNPDIMDLYLTDGKRSIPLLVAFDAAGRELFRWGPRPLAAQEVFAAARAEGLEKAQVLERLHLFYSRDRGRSLEAEFVRLLGAAASPESVNGDTR